MLSTESNDRLTRVGPGTPMGRLMREYWMPALLSEEIAAADCAPVRVMLLGERLVAFRDSAGRVGLFPEACPHRGASLFYGHNEECGLRCAYHGWKFDVTGACLDTPTEPEESVLKRNVRINAYRCVERSGIVWAYMGPRPTPPPLPDVVPHLENRSGQVDVAMIENNWLQALEGDIDIAHVAFLHADNLTGFARALDSRREKATDVAPRVRTYRRPPHAAPLVELRDTVAGFAFATSPPRSSSESESSRTWFVGNFMFPFYANLPYGELGRHWVVARVPMDDYHTMTFGMWAPDVAAAPKELMFGEMPTHLPTANDWFGRFRLARNPANDFMRDPQRAAFGGIGVSGQAVQDAAITASMGPIADRRHEHLGKSDVAIIHLRRRLLAAIERLDELGPPAVDDPRAYRVMHGRVRVASNDDWVTELEKRTVIASVS